jgi:hypothetical protein
MISIILADGNTYINVVYALAAEYKKSLIEFLPIQLKFIDTIKFNTPYCNKILEERRDFIEKVLTKMLTDLSSN